jgi:Flp pilus assembly protein TadD
MVPEAAPPGIERRKFLSLGAGMLLAPHLPKPPGAAPRPEPLDVSGSPLGEMLEAFAQGSDRFPCERQWRMLQPAIDGLCAALRNGSELGALLAPGAECRIAPLRWAPAQDCGWAQVRHAAADWGDAPAFHAWLRQRTPLRGVELDAVAVRAPAPERLRTTVRFGLAGAQPWQASGIWQVDWIQLGEDRPWRISRWQCEELTVTEAAAFSFSDITAAAFSGDPSYRLLLTRDTNYWRTVLDAAAGVDIFGNYGVAVGDVDGDGEDEIYLCEPQGLPNRLYRRPKGSSGLEYQEVSAAAGVDLLDATSMALFADLRNRGRQDLIVITQSQPLVFWNEGGGRFRLDGSAIPPNRGGAALTGAALADYDGDGFLDLYVCSYGYFQGSGANPLPRPYFNARNGPPNHLYHNLGDGRFQDATRKSGLDRGNDRFSFACAWTRWDRNLRPDLLVINDFGEDNFYRNRGDGTFEEVAGGLPGHGAGMSISVADFAGRGLQPYVANMWTPAGLRVTADPGFRQGAPEEAEALREMAAGNRLYERAAGAEAWTPAGSGASRGGWAWCCDSVDIGNRGRPDLYCVNGFLSAPAGRRRPALNSFFWQEIIARTPPSEQSAVSAGYSAAWEAGFQLAHRDHDWYGRQRNVCFLNLGDGRFADASGVSGLDFDHDGRAFAVFDADGDGGNDLVLRSRTGPQLRLLRNAAGRARRRLAVRLRGRRGNWDAIGARLTLTTTAGREVRELRAGSGFLSQHSKRLVFGMGYEERADLRIDWPAGGVSSFGGLAAGFCYTCTEGAEELRREPLRSRGAAASAPAVAEAIPARFPTPLVDPLPLPEWSTLGLDPACAHAELLWLCRAGDATEAAGLPRTTVLDWQRTPARFRTFCATLLAYLYDRRRRLALPAGLQVRSGHLVQVFWGGAERSALAAALARPPAHGTAALPFSGRAVLCSFQRDTRQLGAALQTAGLSAAAALYLQQAAAMFSRDAEVFYNLGLARRGAGEARAARASAAQALALRPGFAAAENLLGVLAMDRGEWPQARRWLARATRHAPDDASAWNNLGYAQLQQGNLAAASASLNRALRLAPDFANARNNLGIVAARQGDLARAEREFELALAAAPRDQQAANNLAVAQAQRGHLTAAAATLQALLRRQPAARAALLNLARLQLERHQPQAARRLLRGWLARHPTDAAALALLRSAGN